MAKLCECGKPAGPTGLCADCFLGRDSSQGSLMRPPTPTWKNGDEALLEENDAFGTQTRVKVVKLCKAGTVHLLDLTDGTKRVNHINNLISTKRRDEFR